MKEKRVYIAGIGGTNKWICVSSYDADEAISLAKNQIKNSNAAREIGFRQISNDETL